MAQSSGPVRVLAWSISIVFSFGALGGLGFVKYGQISAAMAQAAAFPEPSESVEMVTVGTAMVADTVNVIGDLQAVQLVDLRAEVPGVIETVGFASGEEVRKGQILTRIDTSAERADLDAARVDAERASSEARREVELFERGATSQALVEQTRAVAASASALVKALETQIERKTILAPFDGKVGITDLRPGQYVGAGDLITQIVGLQNKVYVDFTVPQRSAVLVDRTRPVTVSLGDLSTTANITAVNPVIDRATRSLRFRALISDGTFTDAAGGLVTVALQMDEPQDLVVVPRTSVSRSPYGDAVYVLSDVDGELRASSRQVRLGQTVGDDLIVVTDGLAPGLVIAADGSFKLRDGALVSPATDERPVSSEELADASGLSQE